MRLSVFHEVLLQSRVTDRGILTNSTKVIDSRSPMS